MKISRFTTILVFSFFLYSCATAPVQEPKSLALLKQLASDLDRMDTGDPTASLQAKHTAERIVYMFATLRTGQMQLIRRDLAGHEQALPLGADFIRGATLSPDRQRLAFESWTIRQRIVRSLARLGAELDDARNAATVKGQAGPITTDASALAVWVVPTNEELMIARDTRQMVRPL